MSHNIINYYTENEASSIKLGQAGYIYVDGSISTWNSSVRDKDHPNYGSYSSIIMLEDASIALATEHDPDNPISIEAKAGQHIYGDFLSVVVVGTPKVIIYRSHEIKVN